MGAACKGGRDGGLCQSLLSQPFQPSSASMQARHQLCERMASALIGHRERRGAEMMTPALWLLYPDCPERERARGPGWEDCKTPSFSHPVCVVIPPSFSLAIVHCLFREKVERCNSASLCSPAQFNGDNLCFSTSQPSQSST